jgi:hypothetical protein
MRTPGIVLLLNFAQCLLCCCANHLVCAAALSMIWFLLHLCWLLADACGSTTLIADLGCFTIKSNPPASQSMSAEEAALYEPFVAKVDHVSAYLLDGSFAWPSNEELAAAAAEAAAGPAAEALGDAQQQQAAGAGESVLQRLLARRARVVSLLDRFGLGVDLQVATSVHPR